MTRVMAVWATLGACLVIAAGSAWAGYRASEAHWQRQVIDWQRRVQDLEREKQTAAALVSARTEQLQADVADLVERLRGAAVVVVPDDECQSLPQSWGRLWDER